MVLKELFSAYPSLQNARWGVYGSKSRVLFLEDYGSVQWDDPIGNCEVTSFKERVNKNGPWVQVYIQEVEEDGIIRPEGVELLRYWRLKKSQ